MIKMMLYYVRDYMYIGDAWSSSIWETEILQIFQSHDIQKHYADIMLDVFCDQEFSPT